MLFSDLYGLAKALFFNWIPWTEFYLHSNLMLVKDLHKILAIWWYLNNFSHDLVVFCSSELVQQIKPQGMLVSSYY